MASLKDLSYIFTALVVLYCIFWILRACYRLFFHPLSRYPGSPLAAISKPWYEWYWNFYHKGHLIFEIQRLHDRLGPVVRIAPNELHISDPDVYLEMTKVGSQFTKDPSFYSLILFPGTSVAESDPHKHRIRRQVLSPAFSPSRVQELSSDVKEKVDELLQRFNQFADPTKPINISAALKAFTMDVVSSIVLGNPLGCINEPDFRNRFMEDLEATCDMGWTPTTFPNLTKFSLALPDWLSERLLPIPIMDFKRRCTVLIDEYLNSRQSTTAKSCSDAPPSTPATKNTSIVLDMLTTPNPSRSHTPLNRDELTEEAIILLSAGNDTTANTLISGIYQILRNPDVHERLVDELSSAFSLDGTDITYERARRLPYLTAVIKESLRYSSPFPGRSPRRVPKSGFSLYDHVLPPGTILVTSTHILNRHPGTWGPDANSFRPSRWLSPDPSSSPASSSSSLPSNSSSSYALNTRLDAHMASFYRGTRQCLGKELALCEAYLLLATLFRRFELAIDVPADGVEDEEDVMRWVDLLFTFYTGPGFQLRARGRSV
ncbi:cytochrome P450, partial [Aaosphaeria arxii CBS 175.79]